MTPIFFIGTLGLIAFFYWAAYQSARALKSKAIEINGNLLLSLPEFVFKLITLGICFGLANTLSVDRVENYINWPSRQPLVDLVIGLTIGLATAFVINLISVAAIRLWGKDIYSPDIMKSLIPRNQVEWVLIIIPLLLAVAVEELLFRGLMVGGFSTVVNPWAMALASGVLFGLMHSPQGNLGIVLTGAVGILFGAVFIITGSLLTVIVAHFALNFLQIVRGKEDIAWYERFQEAPRYRRKLARTPDAPKEAEQAPEQPLGISLPVVPVSEKED
jgi:membrane protease YdiL (CAAX protease family)